MNEICAWNITMRDNDVVVYDVHDDLGVRMWYVIVYDCVDVVLYLTFYTSIIEMNYHPSIWMLPLHEYRAGTQK